ncbi:MAG: c-type cytochrome [Woeseiaceae bacterium]|nr:c-type cytochrome [Woeseiaceae bacterium]
MRSYPRIAAGLFAGFLAFAIALTALVYIASERHLRSFELPPAYTYPIPVDAAAVERGAHLTRTRGCRGCHGDDLAGQVMWEVAVAPNLLTLAREESPATLEAAIRHGIGHDGRALYSMPSYNFLRMRDEDLADIIAYLRSLPVVKKELPAAKLPFEIRRDIALGNDAAIAAYTEQNFRHLMKTGLALGERELDMMSSVARSRFAYFTDQEVSDLYAFLSDMSARAIAGLEAGQK